MLLALAPNPYIVLDSSLRIAWMNEAYLRATMRRREDILGQHIFTAFPSDPSTESYRLLSESFARVIDSRRSDEIALIRYDISNADGTMDARYWSATHTPILDAQGQVDFILQHTVDVTEIQSLRLMRDEMGVIERASAVEARNRDLAEESKQLKALLEEAPGFVAVLDGPRHMFRMANRAYRDLVGQRHLVGQSVAEALPEVVEQGFTALLDRVMSTGQAHIARRDKVVLRNGPDREEVRYLDFIYQPIVSKAGEISGIFVQGHDVTDQIEAEAHQQLLINELNHRVKNTLAIVQGLASQSFRRGTVPEEGLVAFFARLSALSAAHNLLTKGNWEAANLAEMVRAGIGGVAGANPDRIGIAGPKVRIAAQLATSIAMVIHELSTNAVKYGALSRIDGRVDVRWSVRADEGVQLLAFEWAESGGPEVEEPVRHGFGTRLIKRGFASDYRSSVDIQFRKSGLCCHFVTVLAGDIA